VFYALEFYWAEPDGSRELIMCQWQNAESTEIVEARARATIKHVLLKDRRVNFCVISARDGNVTEIGSIRVAEGAPDDAGGATANQRRERTAFSSSSSDRPGVTLCPKTPERERRRKSNSRENVTKRPPDYMARGFLSAGFPCANPGTSDRSGGRSFSDAVTHHPTRSNPRSRSELLRLRLELQAGLAAVELDAGGFDWRAMRSLSR
jgi:hypothetical protein